jgi:CspA family cold shock protein
MTIRHQGTIKWFSDDIGFGFIAIQEISDFDKRPHVVEDEMFSSTREGQLVSYQLIIRPAQVDTDRIREGC